MVDPIRARCGPWSWLARVLLAAATLPALADEPAEPPPTTDPSPMLESTREAVRSTTEWLARGVDSWFGPRPFEEGGKVTDGRLSIGLLKRQGESADYPVRFNAHLRLPNAERWGYVFIGRDDQRDAVTDTPDAFSNRQRLLRDRPDDPSFLAGLGIRLSDLVDFRLGFRGGLRPYAQARAGHSWQQPSGLVIDLRETVFWAASDHVGSTTALSLERALAPDSALRWLSAATITQARPHFDWSTSLGAYHPVPGQRLLTFEVLAQGTQGSGVLLSDYGLQMKWEQPIYSNWLRAEILGGHFWPRLDGAPQRSSVWAAGATLKMTF